MKKIFAILFLFFGFGVVQAQEEIKKDTYVQEGDVIAATLYFDSGEISQTGFYTNDGKPTGQWLSYNREGEKISKAQYDHGKKVGKWFFWSGDKLTEVDYEDSRIAEVNTWKNEGTKIVSNH